VAQRLRLVSAPELANYPSVKHLADTHLVAKGLNVLFGPSGCFKSFYMLHQALSIAQTEPVLYVAAEGVSGLNVRIQAWCDYWQRKSDSLHFILHEINLRETPDDLIKQVKVDLPGTSLVVFDTYARCLFGGDENAAKDTGIAIQHCAKIQRGLDCAVTLVHHTNKAERGERGSSAMRGAADAMIEMSDTDGIIRVMCSKAKDGQPWETELYRFLPVLESGVLLPADVVSESEELTQKEFKILEFLTLPVFDPYGATAKQIGDALNIPAASLFRILSHLKSNSHVSQAQKGDPYHVTDFGRAEVSQRLPRSRPGAKVVDLKDYRE